MLAETSSKCISFAAYLPREVVPTTERVEAVEGSRGQTWILLLALVGAYRYRAGRACMLRSSGKLPRHTGEDAANVFLAKHANYVNAFTDILRAEIETGLGCDAEPR